MSKGYKNVKSESIISKGNGYGKDQGWWYFHNGPLEETVNRGNFLHNYSNFFLFFRTTSEEPGILAYWPPTTVERIGIMDSYRLLQRYFHNIHNVTVDIVFHTWAAHFCLRGCWKGKTVIRCLLMTVIASGASSASYNRRVEWRTPHIVDPQEKRQPALIVKNKEITLFHTYL